VVQSYLWNGGMLLLVCNPLVSDYRDITCNVPFYICESRLHGWAEIRVVTEVLEFPLAIFFGNKII
jgi:hypothetical protein